MKTSREYISGSKLRETIESQDWEILWTKLQAHTIYRLRFRYGVLRKDRLQELSRDLLHEVLEKVFLEERKWYPETSSDFYDFLTSAIDSHVNNYFTKKDRFQTIGTDNEVYLEKNAPILASGQDNHETDELRDKIYLALRDLGADDEELLAFDCMADGIMKPSEIQKELGITESHRNNILRRLRRRLESVRTKFNIK